MIVDAVVGQLLALLRYRFFAWSNVNAECSFHSKSEIAIEFAFLLGHQMFTTALTVLVLLLITLYISLLEPSLPRF